MRFALSLAALIVGIGSLCSIFERVDSKTIEEFRARCDALAKDAEKNDTMTVVGKDGWLFLGKELRHISVGKFWGPESAKVSKADKPEHADPLPAILDFKSQLDKAGIELLLVPVPPKAIVYRDMISGEVPTKKNLPRLDPLHQAFYALLRREGVQVLDLTEAFLNHRSDPIPTFCRQDTHWSGHACMLAARRIAAEVKDRPWREKMPKREFAVESKSVEIQGDLYSALKAPKPGPESLELGFVGIKASGQLTPIEPDRNSPVLLLGDSHALVFHAGGDMLAKGAGLADHLAMQLGFPVDVIGVRGSGATPARVNLLRRARAQANYLSGKKLVIWCFGAREFTESSGWQKVPVVQP